MPELYAAYVALWAAFCGAALCILAADRKHLLPEWRRYLRFLFLPWKLCLFVPALLFVSFAGRFTNDETWDLVTGAGMSLLTFFTAPWSIGLFYQVAKRRRPWRYLVVATALLLFSSSWFYDGYLLWRDGAYSVRWWSNLLLSPIIYIAAGLLWNLEAVEHNSFDEGGRARLSFLRPDWPALPHNPGFAELLPLAFLFVLVAAYVLTGFVRWEIH
jgi:hypothetical protein